MDTRGYYQKYIVTRVDGKPVDPWTLTLEEHDPLAVPAIAAYADAARGAGLIELADDLDAKVAELTK